MHLAEINEVIVNGSLILMLIAGGFYLYCRLRHT